MDDVEAPRVGDLVEWREERGVLVNADPPFMRTVSYRSYVPLGAEVGVVRRGYEPDAQCRNTGLIARIRRYMDAQGTDKLLPTGAGPSELL